MTTKDQRYQTSGWKQLRLMVLDRDGWVCQIRERGCSHIATDVDHVTAAVEGGDFWDPANLRAACKTCNALLGARLGVTRRTRYRYRTTVAPTSTRF